jgi:type IV pilus assembly protein PilB
LSDERAHLRPVPAPGTVNEAVARETQLPDEEYTGLIPPTRRGGGARFLSDVIAELGFVSAERVQQAVEEAKSSAETPEQILVGAGDLTSEQLARAIAERFGLDFVDLSVYKTDPGALNLVSAQAARRYNAAPIGFDESGKRLLVAMVDPSNVLAIDDLKLMTGHAITRVVGAPEDLASVIGRMSRLDDAVAEAIEEVDDDDDLAALSEIRESADDAPVIKLVNSLIAQAVEEGASDLHFEPMESRDMRVRYRIDGVLHELDTVPRGVMAALTSRLKIMSGVDITERRIPQNGRITALIRDRTVDLRTATLPTVWGEKIVLRVLDTGGIDLDMNKLGFTEHNLRRFAESFTKPHGMVLVTGPTGSGKSTTLYATLGRISKPEINVITVEDPVEYRLRGVNQVQVNHKAGLTFAAVLPAILRSDPDVVLIGEIRDGNTAQIAVEASLTGHLVLSTLHTNDAPGAVTRLTEMGIEPFLVGSSLDCVLAQRLARRLCDWCKEAYLPTEEELIGARWPFDDLKVPEVLYRPLGCRNCANTGFRGRIAIHEVMPVSPEIESLTIRRASSNEIRDVALAQGMYELRADGLAKAAGGLTSVREISRVAI